ncbi:MAG TPA: TAT-variant-translocated molybdopterin oxidoreductase, partial [Planctomycetota bacterium]|nr:TAT-variant-translocated molybdopterin oxidoreductase [Planctomycetota bacterium]
MTTDSKSVRPVTRYWRSLEELQGTEAYRAAAAQEFADGADQIDGVDRRRFLQVMGASVALAGASACRWEKTELLPFVERPEGRVPGVPEHYATCFELAAVAHPLLLTSYEGRPIKVEGNERHPESGGATSPYAQAAPLELYDPDRSQAPLERGAETTWERLAAEV